jgi:hypothetical protein
VHSDAVKEVLRVIDDLLAEDKPMAQEVCHEQDG